MDMYESSPVDTVCVYGIYSCKIVFVKYITQNLFFSLGNIFAVFFFLLYEELYRHFFSKRERVGRTMSSSTHNTSKHMDDDALTAQI